MTQSLLLSLSQIVALTDEALVVVGAASRQVVFASPRALDKLDTPEGAGSAIPIFDLLEQDGGRLQDFLDMAASVSSPLIAHVRRLSDGAQLAVKGHRVTTSAGEACVLLALKGDTELSQRFRLLAEKISALDAEVEQRKLAQELLARNTIALERTLVAIRQMSEIDTSEPAYLEHALDMLRIASESSGAAVISIESGRQVISSVSGGFAEAFEKDTPLDLPAGLAQLWNLPDAERVETISAALKRIARTVCDLSDLLCLPIYVGNAAKACLLLQGGSETRNETEIVTEALASLMSRASVEADLRHSQKLQAIGELTGGIAHDFNNILAVILGNAELVKDHVGRLGTDSIEAELVADIHDAALRGATLTSRLLSFARKQPLKPQSLSLNTALRDLDTLLRRALGEAVNIEIIGAGGLWKSRLDQAQFENALLNLAMNARDAMPGGGKLTIETSNARLDDEYAAQHSEVMPGQYVMVAVSDTGEGMSHDVVREAFTPFFTTKGVGQGSGLGLSMVFGFVKQSNGHVKIYSEVGHGTTVKMYFPRDLTDVATAPDEPAPTRGNPKGAKGHVLAVEDDPAILRYAERTLIVLGYTVDIALTGDDAAKLLRSRSYDILLTDVVLPGLLNGARLAALAHEISPSIKVLYMSGYTENAIVHNGQLDPGVDLITKPFTRDQLARRLHMLNKG